MYAYTEEHGNEHILAVIESSKLLIVDVMCSILSGRLQCFDKPWTIFPFWSH